MNLLFSLFGRHIKNGEKRGGRSEPCQPIILYFLCDKYIKNLKLAASTPKFMAYRILAKTLFYLHAGNAYACL